MLRVLATVVASAALAGCSVFGVRSAEQVPYEVVAELGADLQIRRYPERVAAEARVTAASVEDGRGQAFRLLFDYIKGANAGDREIAMTAPVETTGQGTEIAMTVPVESESDATDRDGPASVTMRFFLPATFTRDSAPAPTHEQVRLVQVPAATLAVLRFSGFGGEASVREEKRVLRDRLEDSAWTPAGDPTALFYDPPWTLPFLRRNEVAVPVEPRDDGA